MAEIKKDSLEHKLLKCCRDGTLEEVNRFIEAGADVNARVPYIDGCEEVFVFGEDSWSRPVHAAARNPDLRVIQLLQKRGAMLLVENASGWTPLTNAVINNTKNMFDYLVANGDDPERPLPCGDNMLYLAACNRHKEVLVALLNLGFKIDGEPGAVPLASAALAGTFEDMAFLLDHGAKVAPVLEEKNFMIPVNNLRYLLRRGIDEQGIDLHLFFRDGDSPIWKMSGYEDLEMLLDEFGLFDH